MTEKVQIVSNPSITPDAVSALAHFVRLLQSIRYVAQAETTMSGKAGLSMKATVIREEVSR